jgi:predicted GIY-YIG superfamily endonuclease
MEVKEVKWFCYILRTKNEAFKNYTYNGSTNDFTRRLRQHNGEISGGAKATKNKGHWEIYFLMTGFKTHNNALSCEWAIKHPTKKKIRPKKYCGIEGRIKGLNEILLLERWTTKCELNNDCNYIIYIVKEMAQYLDKTIIPNNITIIEVDMIDKTTVF